MKVLRIILFIALPFGPLYLLPTSDAHLFGGITQDDQGYRFQFLTDPPFAYTGEEVFLTFSIQNASDDLDITNARASVTISRNGEIIESFEAIDVPFGDFGVPYQFDEDSRYNIYIQLDKVGGNPSTEFPLDVIAFRTNSVLPIVGISVGIILLAAVIIKLRSR